MPFLSYPKDAVAIYENLLLYLCFCKQYFFILFSFRLWGNEILYFKQTLWGRKIISAIFLMPIWRKP